MGAGQGPGWGVETPQGQTAQHNLTSSRSLDYRYLPMALATILASKRPRTDWGVCDELLVDGIASVH